LTPVNGRVASRALLLVLLTCAIAAAASGQGRRVVDIVTIGDARSERDHDYAGDRVSEGVIDGTTFRQARGWMRYSLAAFDEGEVTLICTFRGTGGQRLTFDLVVEDRKILTRAFVSASAAPSRIEVVVPTSVTTGKTVLSVTIRGVDGPTPGLIELQNVQEHLERPAR
jgi:hypothetical protein